MDLHGKLMIAGQRVAAGSKTFTATNPATGERLAPSFAEATPAEVDAAMTLAARAFEEYRKLPGRRIAEFIDAVASEIEALGDALTDRCHRETGLPMARMQSERARLVNQTRAFAAMAREGSWVAPRIDRGNPARQPLPKPDVRSMLVPIGPVVTFGASNFPLAISVAGTDTISALAAGCTVVAKSHSSHPGTSELAGGAIVAAARKTGMPDGVFSLLHGAGGEVGQQLARHPAAKAIAFTGSFRGGKALFDTAAARPEPIPVYAEMGSINPVLVLPRALRERGAQIAAAYLQSVTMGVGQFCTNPGLVLGFDGPELTAFLDAAGKAARAVAPATMLNRGIRTAYTTGAERVRGTPGVTVVGSSEGAPAAERTEAACFIFSTEAQNLDAHPHLTEEMFGPASLVVRCRDGGDAERVIRGMGGHLVASVHGTAEDLAEHGALLAVLETKVGRIVYNGFGTGIEVCAAMHHGGPFPATTDAHHTSIGQAAAYRFARPLCYQNCPDEVLPDALKSANPLGLWRLIDNQVTREAV